MKKVVSVEFFRFILMLQICLWHYSSCLGLMKNGYIAVDFFFILSGYLLYRSYSKPNSKSILNYTIAKIKAFLPKIIVAFILFGFTFHANILKSPICILNDLFLLSGMRFFNGGSINYPIWYISILVIGGGIIYAMLKKMGDLALSVLFPLLIILIYTKILANNNFCLEMWSTEGPFHMPFLRGVAAMCLGSVLCKFQMEKCKKLEERYICHLNILFVVAFLGYVYLIFTNTHNDGYVLVCSCVFILSFFSEKHFINKVFYNEFWLYFGHLSLDMLILHAYVLRFVFKMENMGLLQKNSIYNLFVYIPLLLLLSIIFDFLFRRYINRIVEKVF